MIVAAVPVRSLRDAKRRLDVDHRTVLAEGMLAHVLEVLAEARCLSRVAVISPDDEVLALASRLRTTALRQRSLGLNEACLEAATWARDCGARGLLVVHSDLPLLTAESVHGLVATAPRTPSVVLGPDRHGSGTNLLLASPPDIIPFAFGANSRYRHRALARRTGVALVEYVSAATASDVDTARDLAESAHRPPTPRVECFA